MTPNPPSSNVASRLVTADAWQELRGETHARIALGRAGGSLPTREWLAFKAAHAAARDAVHNDFNAEQLAEKIQELGAETIIVSSTAKDRLAYLQQPPLGRRLDDLSRDRLLAAARTRQPCDLGIIVSDGLSALAAHRQAAPLLAELLPRLRDQNWRVSPVVVARFARVALQDDIGAALGLELALMLIGERPGLAASDSLGAYLTYGPRPGKSDAQRNCVSNIRPEGLCWKIAAETLIYLLNEARRRRLSGVELKDQRSLGGAEQAVLAARNG